MPGKRSFTMIGEAPVTSASSKKARPSPSYTSTQKAQIIEFAQLAHIDKTSAAKALRAGGWQFKTALETFFANQDAAATNVHKTHLNKLFDEYREDAEGEPDEVNIEGTMRMMSDCGIDVEDVAAFIFAELVKSPSLGKMARSEFVNGLAQEGATDLAAITRLVQRRRASLTDPEARSTFKSIYKHAFIIARPSGQKSVPLEMASEYWKSMLRAPSLEWSTPNADWLAWWLEFLHDRSARNPDKDSYKTINKDTWEQTLAFAYKTLEDPNLGWWTEDSAWPSVIDEFVDYLRLHGHVPAAGESEAMDVS